MSFQDQIDDWMQKCFGAVISSDQKERNYRFLEEALELAQACECSKEDALKLVDYVYGRPVGEDNQEVGGVMVTLAALCSARHLFMDRCADTELHRIWRKMDQIRAKHETKPLRSPLPGETVTPCGLRLCQTDDPAVVSVSEIIGVGAFRVGICQQCADELGLKEDSELPDFVTVKKMIDSRPEADN